MKASDPVAYWTLKAETKQMEIDIEELTFKNKRDNILMMLKHSEERAKRIIEDKKEQLVKYRTKIAEAEKKVAAAPKQEISA
jgi:hypothetical protein